MRENLERKISQYREDKKASNARGNADSQIKQSF